MNPKPGLAGVLEARVIAIAFGTKGLGTLEGSAGSVNGESVIVGAGDIPGTAAVFLYWIGQSLDAIIPMPL